MSQERQHETKKTKGVYIYKIKYNEAVYLHKYIP